MRNVLCCGARVGLYTLPASEQTRIESSGERLHGLVYAFLESIARVNHNFRQQDRFETRFALEIQIQGSVARRVRVRFRLCGDAGARELLRANALQNAPRLRKFAGGLQNPVNLLTPREGATIEDDDAAGILAESPTRRLQHDFHHEVVLLG